MERTDRRWKRCVAGKALFQLARPVWLGLLLWALAASPAAAQGQNVRLVGQIGGECNAAQVVGSYAYVGEGPSLRILDVSNTSAPVALGRVMLPFHVQDVDVAGGIAYVADGLWGLQIIGVSNPSSPTLRGSYDTPQYAQGVHVVGTLAYVADSESGLQIIDVSDPSSPTLRGSYNTLGRAQGVQVVGSLAYVADWESGLQIIDVSNPSSPTLRGAYDTPGYAAGVYVSGTLAYVADNTSGGLQIIDVSNPSSPTLCSSYHTPGGPMRVYVTSNTAYLAEWSYLRIVDVSNPSSPTLRGSYYGNWAADVQVVGGLAYVAAHRASFHIVDVSNPQSPTLRGIYKTPSNVWDVHVSNGLAYVADSVEGLRIIDVNIPTSPSLRGAYRQLWSPGEGVDVAGGLAYLAEGGDLRIIDVSNPWSPTLRGSYATPGYAREVCVSGLLLYVADDAAGLLIVDISAPTTPTLRGSYDTPEAAWDVCVRGDLAYVADGLGGLQIIDTTNPSAPTLRGSYNTPAWARDIFLSGNLAYVADAAASAGIPFGIRIIDVNNPSSPTLEGFYPLGTFGVLVSGASAYVAAGSAFSVLDVTEPSQPMHRGQYWLSGGEAVRLDAANGLVYVATVGGGLWIFQYTGEAPRVEGATISDVNNNGAIEAGDQLVLTLDRSVVVTTSVLRASHFFLAVEGDSLGGAGFAVDANRYNSRQIALTLGAGAHLTAASSFSMQNRTPNSPSGIDFATSIPFGAIKSLDGISAIDGGVFGVDDSGIDIELSMVGRSANVAAAGGTVAVVPSPDAAYTRHELVVPTGALVTTTTFQLRPPMINLGVINAVQIESDPPGVAFATSATVRIEYREGDIDFERGQIESEMRVHRLVEGPPGFFRYRQVAGPQTLNMVARQISVGVSSLAPPTLPGVVGPTSVGPRKLQGSGGIFAGLPIETVDERTVVIGPSGGGIVKGAGPAVLTPGSRGAYTFHRIEFPGYVEESGTTDPARLTVTMRTTTLAERYAQSGGRSFPSQSGAIFTVTVTDASSAPVQFTSPVHLTVQFKDRPDPGQTDVVYFDRRPAPIANMRLVLDSTSGEAVDFVFADVPDATVNIVEGTVTVQNLVGLTGADGTGTWGAVGREISLRSVHWSLYR